MELKVCVKENMSSISKNALSLMHSNICAISCENVVVFTRLLLRPSSFKQSIPIHAVFAADLNTIFESHVIMESLDPILNIKFDSTGQHLIIVTASRHMQLFTKGPGIHRWNNAYTSNWAEEEILYIDFLHMMKRPQIQTKDININGTYVEKFQCSPHNPSLISYANCPQKGFFAVTASGLFLLFTINANGVVDDEEKCVLGPLRDHYTISTAAFDPNGSIHIAACKHNVVKCWEVKLSYREIDENKKEDPAAPSLGVSTNRKLQIEVVSSYCFSPNKINSSDKNVHQDAFITHVVFSDQYDPTNLVLSVDFDQSDSPSLASQSKSQTGQNAQMKEDHSEQVTRYAVQRYQLQPKSRPVFKFFNQSSSGENSNATQIKEWVGVCEFSLSHSVTCVGGVPTDAASGFAPRTVCVATSDGTILALNKDTLQPITKYTFSPEPTAEDPSRTHVPHAVSVCATWTNLHLLATDSLGSLNVLSLLKQTDIVSCTWPVYLVVLFEYALVSERDWSDILMAVPAASAQTVADRVSETFHLHPLKVVSNLISKFLVLKNSLLRLSSSTLHKSIEVRLEAQLSAIVKMFHSLRPVTADVPKAEKNFHALVHNYIESRNSLEIHDLDKSIENLLFNCNILDLQIDPAFAQDLQTLLEFSMDLALYLLFLLVQNSKFEIAKEPRLLVSLREILFLARVWHRHDKAVSPQMIRKTDAVDIWAQIYKLLTRLAQLAPNEPDPAFLDECILLETQIVCREFPLFIPPRGVLGRLVNTSTPPQFPFQFTYGQTDPNPVISNVNPRRLEGSLPASQPLDPLHHRYLGLSGSHLQCTRCFAMRGSWCGATDSSTWEQEWAARCICSGHWAPSKSRCLSRAA